MSTLRERTAPPERSYYSILITDDMVFGPTPTLVDILKVLEQCPTSINYQHGMFNRKILHESYGHSLVSLLIQCNFHFEIYPFGIGSSVKRNPPLRVKETTDINAQENAVYLALSKNQNASGQSMICLFVSRVLLLFNTLLLNIYKHTA